MIIGSNRVELIGTYGGDETHALSAWTSTSRELDDSKRARMGALLTKLAKDGHHTPFEKSSLHFLVTTDIATHIQMLKHRVGVSINAESARYKELKDDRVYIPTDWPGDLFEELLEFQQLAVAKYHSVLKKLVGAGFSRKRAKESARYFLPYSMQLTADVQFNFRSFAHFVGLRGDPDAQLEIRHLTDLMVELVKGTGQFNLSLTAFGMDTHEPS